MFTHFVPKNYKNPWIMVENTKLSKKKKKRKKIKIDMMFGKKNKKIKEKFYLMILKFYGNYLKNLKKKMILKNMMKISTDHMDKDLMLEIINL